MSTIFNTTHASSFEPEVVERMAKAVYMACARLGCAVGSQLSEEIAVAVFALAQRGERDPERLCEAALNSAAVRTHPRDLTAPRLYPIHAQLRPSFQLPPIKHGACPICGDVMTVRETDDTADDARECVRCKLVIQAKGSKSGMQEQA